jgi:hypothetical protein
MATRDPTTQPVQPTLDLDDGRMVFKKEPIAATAAASVSPAQPHRDTSITKVNARYSPRGKYGQKYLATGIKLSIRLWENEQPGKLKSLTQRDYETAGYVISGRAELEIEGQTIVGTRRFMDNPERSRHRYKILEPFTAVEATCPPLRCTAAMRSEN